MLKFDFRTVIFRIMLPKVSEPKPKENCFAIVKISFISASLRLKEFSFSLELSPKWTETDERKRDGRVRRRNVILNVKGLKLLR